MSEADDTRLELLLALEGIGRVTAILYSLEHEVNVVKGNVNIAGVGSNRNEPEFVGAALARTLIEISAMITRMHRLKTGVEEWRNAL